MSPRLPLATTTRARILKVKTAAKDDQVKKDNRFPSPPGISGFIHPDSVPRSDWNLRNFGHFINSQSKRGAGTITTRTLGEIIDSTHLMNDIIRRKDTSGKATATDPAGPGLICKDEAAVWNCTVHGGSGCFDVNRPGFSGDQIS